METTAHAAATQRILDALNELSRAANDLRKAGDTTSAAELDKAIGEPAAVLYAARARRMKAEAA